MVNPVWYVGSPCFSFVSSTKACLVHINSFPAERILSLRERAAGTYLASAYFLAKTTSDIITHVGVPIIFAAIVYPTTGLQPVASKFFVFLSFMIMCSLSATSLALAISAICRTTSAAVTVLPMYLELCRLFGGFFLSPKNLPVYFSWLDALSYVKYTYVGISLNELSGLVLTCSPSEANSAGVCPTSTGDQTINALGLNYISIEGCAAVLLGMVVVLRGVAYLGVRFIKW